MLECKEEKEKEKEKEKEEEVVNHYNSILTQEDMNSILNVCKFKDDNRANCWVNNSKIPNIISKIQKLVNIKLDHFENMCVTKYKEGSVHGNHFDAYILNSEKAKRCFANVLGQRLMTITGFLSPTVVNFPKLNKKFECNAGAVLYYGNCINNSNKRNEMMSKSYEVWDTPTSPTDSVDLDDIDDRESSMILFNIYIREGSRSSDKILRFNGNLREYKLIEEINQNLDNELSNDNQSKEDNLLTIRLNNDKLDLKIYTNKNDDVFITGSNAALNDLKVPGKYGLVYDDINSNSKVINDWSKENPDRKIFWVAPRIKTKIMDDKLGFYKKMSKTISTPDSYLSYYDIPENTESNELFFIKNIKSAGAKCVNIYRYSDLESVDTTGCVIQKSMNIPDLYSNKRYKLRGYVLVYKNNVYYYKENFIHLAYLEYNNEDNLRDRNIVYQRFDVIWVLSNKLDNHQKIQDNIVEAVKEFKERYKGEINDLLENEFTLLGFDFVVDSNKNVYIIEINHRPNLGHPTHSSCCNGLYCIKDMIKILINNDHTDTDYIKI